MHTNLIILNFLKVQGENSVFQHQFQGPQDFRGPQAILAPRVHLVSIPLAKAIAWQQMAP